MKNLTFLLCLGFLGACKETERHFWYPLEVKQVTCSGHPIEVYKMTNSRGWRSWPYYVDLKDGKEVEFGTACSFKTLKTFTKFNTDIEAQLAEEQRNNIIEGFYD